MLYPTASDCIRLIRGDFLCGRVKRCLVGVLGGLIIAIESPALFAGARVIEEVVVTAQRRAQSAQDVSISMAAFTGEKMRNLGVVNTADIAGIVPGFTFTQGNTDVPIFTIRGVGFDEISQTGSSTVGIYIDEISLPYPVMSKGADLDTQRIEVLKGPQGTLYGRNTTGGAVNYIANKPAEQFEAGVSARYGRFGTTDIEGYLSGGIIDGVNGRAAYRSISSSEGWQKNIVFPGERNGELDKWSGRILLDWVPSERINFSLSYEQWRDKSEAQMPQPFVRLDQAQIVGFRPSQRFEEHPLVDYKNNRDTAWDPDKQQGGIGIGRDYGLDEKFENAFIKLNWEITPAMALQFSAAQQRFRNDNYLNIDGMAVEQFEYIIQTKTDATTFELKLDGAVEGLGIDWVLGYFHSTDKVDEFRDFGVLDNSTGNGGTLFQTIIVEGIQDSKAQAVFGQVEWQAWEAVKFTLGLRYTEETKKYAGCSRDKDGDTALAFSALQLVEMFQAGSLSGDLITNEDVKAFVDAFDEISGRENDSSGSADLVQLAFDSGLGDIGEITGGPGRGDCFTLDSETGRAGVYRDTLKEDNISGRFAIDWTPRENLLLYAALARGFKSGSFPLVPASRSEQIEPVTQEKVMAYELGVKSRWLDQRLQVNAALFHYDYDDKQLFAFFNDEIFGTLQKLENVEESVVRGIEIDIEYRLLSSLLINASAAFLDTEVKKHIGTNADGEMVSFAGNEINYAPRFEGVLLFDYERPVGRSLAIHIGADYSYSSRTEGELSNDPDFERPSYYLVNARLGLRDADDRWSATIWSKNLTDTVYYTAVQRLSDVGTRFTGMPRTYGVAVTYRW